MNALMKVLYHIEKECAAEGAIKARGEASGDEFA
jgi:hypothetical protein